MISHFNALYGKEARFTLQFCALVILILQLLQQAFFYLPQLIVPCSHYLVFLLRLPVSKEFYKDWFILPLVLFLDVFSKLFHFYLSVKLTKLIVKLKKLYKTNLILQ